MLPPYWTNQNTFERRVQIQKSHGTPHAKQLKHPAEHAPRFFADTADRIEIEKLKATGLIQGVTTNPTLLKNNGANSWQSALEMMREVTELMLPFPVSLELTALNGEMAMIEQGKQLAALGENVVVKVPVAGYPIAKQDPYTGVKVIKALWEADIRTNATLVFNTNQAYLAAAAGATYVSPFLGRLHDALSGTDFQERVLKVNIEGTEHVHPATAYNTGYVATDFWDKQALYDDPEPLFTDAGVRLINEIVSVFNRYQITCEVLAASIRTTAQVTECMLAGADILTVPNGVLNELINHPLSDQGLLRFIEDAKVYTES